MNAYLVLRDTGSGACFLPMGGYVHARDLAEASELALREFGHRFKRGDLLMVSRMGVPSVAVHRITKRAVLGPI